MGLGRAAATVAQGVARHTARHRALAADMGPPAPCSVFPCGDFPCGDFPSGDFPCGDFTCCDSPWRCHAVKVLAMPMNIHRMRNRRMPRSCRVNVRQVSITCIRHHSSRPMKKSMSFLFLPAWFSACASRHMVKVICLRRISPETIILAAFCICDLRVAIISCIARRHCTVVLEVGEDLPARLIVFCTSAFHARKVLASDFSFHWLMVPRSIFIFVSLIPAYAPLIRSERCTIVCVITRSSAPRRGSSGARPCISPKSMEPLLSRSKRRSSICHDTSQLRPGACSAAMPRSQSSLPTWPGVVKSSIVSSVSRNETLGAEASCISS